MTIVYLFDRFIRVVEGESSRGKVRIKGLYHTIDTQGCIVNGTILDQEALADLIGEMWEREKLPKKDVCLVFNSTQITTKTIDVPFMKKQQMMDFVVREFADVERIDDPVCSYYVLKGSADRKKKLQSVFAAVASKSFLQTYVDIFEGLGIKLSRIEGVRGSVLRLVSELDTLEGKTCVVQFVDSVMLVNIILHKGNIVYSGRVRLFSDPGTPEQAVEVARSVSNVLQFAKTQDIQDKITEVYISGLGEDTMEFYLDSIQRIDETLEGGLLDLGQSVQIDSGVSREEVRDYTLALGCLWPVDLKTGFLEQLLKDPVKEEKRAKMIRTLIPIGVLALILGGTAGVLGFQYFSLKKELTELREYNSREDIVEACKEYDALNEEISRMRVLEENAEKLKSVVEAYPMADSSIVRTVAACADGLVDASIRSYTAEGGTLSLSATAGNVEQINRFITRLKEQPCFIGVDYTGYQQDSDGGWITSVSCTLAGREVEVHETDDETD